MKENEQDDNVLEGLNQNVKNMFHDILIESIGLKDIEASLIKPLKQKIEGLDDTISSFFDGDFKENTQQIISESNKVLKTSIDDVSKLASDIDINNKKISETLNKTLISYNYNVNKIQSLITEVDKFITSSDENNNLISEIVNDIKSYNTKSEEELDKFRVYINELMDRIDTKDKIIYRFITKNNIISIISFILVLINTIGISIIFLYK